MRILVTLFAVLTFAGVVISQPKCDLETGYSLNPEKPSIYIEFEQFGKAQDWGSYRLGEPMKKPEIKKGDDVWLRLFNNSCWEITFKSLSAYTQLVDDPANPGKKKLTFDLVDGAGVNVAYVSEEQDRRQVPWGGDNFSISGLLPGRSLVFPVYKGHLAKSRSIYVPYNYKWEKDKWGYNLPPEHRSFFWGYRLEDVKKK